MALRSFSRKLGSRFVSNKVGSRFFSHQHREVPNSAYATERILDVGQPTPQSHPELLVEGEITPGISRDEYIYRRKRLLELLPEKSLAIIASAPVKMMTDVVPYPFRQDADYLYLTGCSQHGGIAVFSEESGLCMFMPDLDPDEAAWQSQVAGVEAALDFFKADKAFPLSKMNKVLPEMIERASRLFHNKKTASPSYMELEAFVRAKCDKKVKDISTYTHEMRFIKSSSEISLMRQSASIACQALLQAMLLSRVFPEESKLSAKVEYECKTRGAQRMAFNPVVGGGANGSVIHYSRNDRRIRAGELLLMDIGCEFHGYLSDLTRTWPPCGNFSAVQELLYNLILETNKECLKLCKPGASVRKIHDVSVRMLRKGLKEIGVMKGESNNFYYQLNPTSIGHYLGMDIHDCSLINNDRPLQPGTVITIEPGVYIPLSAEVPERFRGIGIRIEDEVLITETGHEVLTGSMPKEISHLNSVLNFGANKGSDNSSELRAAFS